MRGASIGIAGFLVLLALLVVPAPPLAASGPPDAGFTAGDSILSDPSARDTQTSAADGTLPVIAENQVAPAITVSPASGPPGTSFVVTGTGFTPGSSVLFGAVNEATEPVAAELLQVAADGTFQTAIDSTGFAPGQYTVVVGTSDASALLASGAFTVTAGGAGGGGTGGPTTMPRSGGGGMMPDAGPARLLPSGLAIVACAVLGAVAARRRRAH